ncbi:glycosyltransferase family 2 protein [Pelodictyon luteolum]|uniref:Glycosyl transferase n=1 Tax=Chlorobium luteolum (strain DSM 273 / BCRC 81028 / 2530) TaxID=319225 RepID=Q3B5R4_CHLL3|nr:glycosyltransferase family 2 protein [Pelodictyon luteolum]ABB23317.1 glycosyl transferase [Pelodictyon luteolum DSM 273]
MITLSVVVPFYNERESIPELVGELSGALSDPLLHGLLPEPFSHEIILVDDGSTDGSGEAAKAIAETVPEVKLISFRKNSGKTAALSAGFRAAEGLFICTLDADLQDDPRSIRPLLEKLLEGYDLVSGWKLHRNDPVTKTVPSRIFNAATRLFTGVRLHDINCGLKLYRREVPESIELHGDMHRYIPVLAAWKGYRIAELPVLHRRRRYGRTKYGSARFLKGLFDFFAVLFITRYFRRPMHFFGMAGLVSFLLGFSVSAYVTLDKVLNNRYISNRPILFLGILLLILGVQLFSTGLLGEMLSTTSGARESFLIRDTLNLTPEQQQKISE